MYQLLTSIFKSQGFASSITGSLENIKRFRSIIVDLVSVKVYLKTLKWDYYHNMLTKADKRVSVWTADSTKLNKKEI